MWFGWYIGGFQFIHLSTWMIFDPFILFRFKVAVFCSIHNRYNTMCAVVPVSHSHSHSCIVSVCVSMQAMSKKWVIRSTGKPAEKWKTKNNKRPWFNAFYFAIYAFELSYEFWFISTVFHYCLQIYFLAILLTAVPTNAPMSRCLSSLLTFVYQFFIWFLFGKNFVPIHFVALWVVRFGVELQQKCTISHLLFINSLCPFLFCFSIQPANRITFIAHKRLVRRWR